MIALTFYDYLLMFNDEIRYVWRGRKTWIFYLYILNRALLIAYQSWEIYYTSGPRNSKAVCLASYYFQVVLIMFFLFSSDIFIALRIYAITFRNKILATYFVALAVARLTVVLVAMFVRPPTIVDLPQLPVDAFNLCGIVVNPPFKMVPNAIATTFEVSAFLVIIWYSYRNKGTLKLSALVRTIVTDATIYFLAMVTLQIYIQVSYVLTEGINQQLSSLAYGFINPILSMRFALSLKRSADPGGGQEWRLNHFTSANFDGSPSSYTQKPAVSEDFEMDAVGPRERRLRTRWT